MVDQILRSSDCRVCRFTIILVASGEMRSSRFRGQDENGPDGPRTKLSSRAFVRFPPRWINGFFCLPGRHVMAEKHDKIKRHPVIRASDLEDRHGLQGLYGCDMD